MLTQLFDYLDVVCEEAVEQMNVGRSQVREILKLLQRCGFHGK